MSQRIAKRWKSRFARFVGEYGAKRIASELRIDASATIIGSEVRPLLVRLMLQLSSALHANAESG